MAAPGTAAPEGGTWTPGARSFIRENGSDKFRVVRSPAPRSGSGFDFQTVEDWAVIWLPIIFMGDPDRRSS